MNPQPPPPGEGMFFTAGTRKLVLLSLCSFGLYDIYWFWRNWRLFAARSGRRIRAPWRAVLAIIWVYPMFREIRKAGAEFAIGAPFHAGIMALFYIYFSLAAYFDDPWSLVSFLTVLPLIAANDAAREINRRTAPFYTPNDSLSRRNWIVVIIGGLLLLLTAAQMAGIVSIN